MKYTIVRGCSAPENNHVGMSAEEQKDGTKGFIERVNDKLQEGWEPLGAISVVHWDEGTVSSPYVYFQSLVKK
jgi:hypothetical protein